MKRPTFGQYSIRYIIIALAFPDNLVICMSLFNKRFILEMLRYDVRSLSNFSCKIYYWFWRMAKATSSWNIILISIERFTALWFRFKAKSIMTKKTVILSIWLVYIFLTIYVAVMSYFTDFVLDGVCQVSMTSDNNRFLERPLVVLESCIMVIFLAIIISTLNTLQFTNFPNKADFANKFELN